LLKKLFDLHRILFGLWVTVHVHCCYCH